MSCVTESATTVLDEPMTVTAQQFPFAVTVFCVPLTSRVASLQSSTCSMPWPMTWVSPFLACAVGGSAAGLATRVTTQVASGPATLVHFTAGPLALAGDLARLSLEKGYVHSPAR